DPPAVRQLLHTRQRAQRYFHTTVLRTAIGGGVARYRLIRPHATGAHPAGVDTLRQQVIGYALCTSLRQVHVVAVRAGAVGMTDYLDAVLVVLTEGVGQVVERLIEAAGDLRRVGSEGDVRRA